MLAQEEETMINEGDLVMKLHIKNNPLVPEASAIIVVDENGRDLVNLQGPMSMMAAGGPSLKPWKKAQITTFGLPLSVY